MKTNGYSLVSFVLLCCSVSVTIRFSGITYVQVIRFLLYVKLLASLFIVWNYALRGRRFILLTVETGKVMQL
jgi:hypothetical protein